MLMQGRILIKTNGSGSIHIRIINTEFYSTGSRMCQMYSKIVKSLIGGGQCEDFLYTVILFVHG